MGRDIAYHKVWVAEGYDPVPQLFDGEKQNRKPTKRST